MTDKVTLLSFGSDYRSFQNLNTNNQTIQTAFDNTLSRDGTSPNQMEANLDMNSNRVINTGAPVLSADAVRLVDLQNAISAFNPSGLTSLGALFVQSSKFSTLSAADAASTAVGGYLLLDSNWTLTSNLTLNSKVLAAFGGVITLNGHTLTFNNTYIQAGPVQVFDVTTGGTGVLAGNIQNDTMYPEWAGALNYLSTAANATATWKAVKALEAFDSQSANYGRWLIWSAGSYAVDQPCLNPTAGKALRWIGHGPTTVIYSTVNTQIRTLTGSGSGSLSGVFMRNLQLSGLTAGGTTANLTVIDWCHFEHHGISYGRAAYGFELRSATSFSENVKGNDNIYSSLTSACIYLNTNTGTGGTGSFRGFGETNFLYSRGASTDATTFLRVGNGADGSFLYNGNDISGTVTSDFGSAVSMYLVDSQSTTTSFKKSAVEFETAAANTITLGKTNTVLFGGGFAANSPSFTVLFGTALCNCSYMLTTGGITNILTGFARFGNTVTGNATHVLPITVYGGSYRATFLIDAGFDFTAFVDAEVYVDSIGSQNQINVLTVKVPYNGLGLTFTSANVTVNTSGQAQWQANIGADNAVVTGIQTVIGCFQ